MNLFRLWVFTVSLLSAILLPAADPESFAPLNSPAGHWKGAIVLPATELAIEVNLEMTEDGRWSGTIDIPVQMLRAHSLDPVEITGRDVRFGMPGIPGTPIFEGTMNPDGTTIDGQFSQSGQTFPFNLKRAPKTETAGATPAKGIPGTGFAGFWQGSLTANAFELRLLLRTTRDDSGNLTGTLDSIDQGAKNIPLANIRETAATTRFDVPSINAGYSGQFTSDGSELVGTWKQAGQSMPLRFKRLAGAPDFSRPQDPAKPYPYIEEQVRFENATAGIQLAGTLTLPDSPGPHPAVVLITGSGPQDRDESIMGHRPFLVLADHLTRHGIAVLRYDDRGVGESQGDYPKASLSDFDSDVLAALTFLRHRPEIDPARVGLLGHSEGGIHAVQTAAATPEVAFVVLLAGVGVPMEEVLLRQTADTLRITGAGEPTVARQTALQRQIFRILKEKRDSPEARSEVRELLNASIAAPDADPAVPSPAAALIEGQIRMMFTPLFLDLLQYDPRPALEQVKCPVLALNGERDVQVAAGPNLTAIADALREGGNTNVQTLELSGLNHLFQTCATGAVSEYGSIEETIAPAALTLISDWLRDQTAR